MVERGMLRILSALWCTFLLLGSWTAVSARADNEPKDREGWASALTLANLRRITPISEFKAAVWSPSVSTSLAFVGRDGTYLYSEITGEVSQLTSHVAGFKFFWTADGRYLVYRSRLDERTLAIEQIEISTGFKTTLVTAADLGFPQEVAPGNIHYHHAGRLRSVTLSAGVTAAASKPYVFQLNDAIYVADNGSVSRMTSEVGQHFLPQLSPDGTKVLYQELSRGILVADLQRKMTLRLGEGDDPVWSPEGDLVLFEISQDDGHVLLGSDLYVADLEGGRRRLTFTPNLLELRPSWSRDGRQIAFDAGGAIYIADAVWSEP